MKPLPKEARETIEPWLDEARAIAKKLAGESPLKDEASKSALAEAVAFQMIYLQRFLYPAALSGVATSETLRTIPGINSNIKRGLDALGVTKTQPEELGDLFGSED